MADDEEREQNSSRGNEWEVVSLTASTYAAAPGPTEFESNDGDKGGNDVGDDEETSRALFMSGHFVLSPTQRETLPLEPDNTEIHSELGGKVVDTKEARSDMEEGNKSHEKNEENWNIEALTAVDEFPGMKFFEEKGKRQSVHDKEFEQGTTLQGLNLVEEGKSIYRDEENWNIKALTTADEFPGIQFFNEKVKRLSVHGTEFEEGTGLQGLKLIEEGKSIYSSVRFSSFHGEADISGSTMSDENTVIPEPSDPSHSHLDSPDDFLKSPSPTKENKYNGSGLPCEAWWKRRASSLYAHVKEANAYWSVFVAAALMGLIILGQQWQHERWQIQQLRWQFSINDEISRMLGPITRFKDVIVGGHRRGSAIRGSTSAER